MADTEAELHAFALLIGMKPEWQHQDHFDLTPARRIHAVALGAREVTIRDLVLLRRRQRGVQ